MLRTFEKQHPVFGLPQNLDKIIIKNFAKLRKSLMQLFFLRFFVSTILCYHETEAYMLVFLGKKTKPA